MSASSGGRSGNRKMIVHHYNTYINGGAAIAAQKLHRSLVDHGVESRYFFKSGEGGRVADPSYGAFGPKHFPVTLPERLFNLLSGGRSRLKALNREKEYYLGNRAEVFDLFSFPGLHRPTVPVLGRSGPDIIHLHWVADLIDYESFFSAPCPDCPEMVVPAGRITIGSSASEKSWVANHGGNLQSEVKEAVEVFKLVLLAYPEWADANGSLAEAYLADGQKDLARELAEKALALLDSHAVPASSWTDTEPCRGEIRRGAGKILKKLDEVR